jgi:hypothetical protein
MNRLSIVGKDPQTDASVIGYYHTGDRMKYWGQQGAFWGGLWSLLFGSAFFLIPGIGPFVVAGPLVQAIVAALEGAIVVGGMSAIGAGLYSIGVPEGSVLEYETALKADACLLVAHGSGTEVARAKEIFETTASIHVGQYPAAQLS